MATRNRRRSRAEVKSDAELYAELRPIWEAKLTAAGLPEELPVERAEIDHDVDVETLPDISTPPSTLFASEEERRQLNAIQEAILACLDAGEFTPHERLVLALLYEVKPPWKQRDIGSLIASTEYQVTRLKRRIWRKIRAQMCKFAAK